MQSLPSGLHFAQFFPVHHPVGRWKGGTLCSVLSLCTAADERVMGGGSRGRREGRDLGRGWSCVPSTAPGGSNLADKCGGGVAAGASPAPPRVLLHMTQVHRAGTANAAPAHGKLHRPGSALHSGDKTGDRRGPGTVSSVWKPVTSGHPIVRWHKVLYVFCFIRNYIMQ